MQDDLHARKAGSKQMSTATISFVPSMTIHFAFGYEFLLLRKLDRTSFLFWLPSHVLPHDATMFTVLLENHSTVRQLPDLVGHSKKDILFCQRAGRKTLFLLLQLPN